MSRSLGTAARRLAMVALASACGAAAAHAESFTMGYSVGFLTDPFQAIQVDLTMAEAEKAGLETLPVANANGDAGKQITDFHNLIAQGAEGIIVVPTDSDAIAPALAHAASQNVPVVAIDIGPAGCEVAMIVRADNIRMGEDACQHMGEALGGEGTVLR